MSIAILQSINPPHCENIASRKKTVEVRKTKPKLVTPFKVYIYCTKDKRGWFDFLHKTRLDGKVIGEYICDEILDISNKDLTENFRRLTKTIIMPSCLTVQELKNYLGFKNGCGWHISNLIIYEQPKELSEFVVERYPCLAKLNRPPQSWCYVKEL